MQLDPLLNNTAAIVPYSQQPQSSLRAVHNRPRKHEGRGNMGAVAAAGMSAIHNRPHRKRGGAGGNLSGLGDATSIDFNAMLSTLNADTLAAINAVRQAQGLQPVQNISQGVQGNAPATISGGMLLTFAGIAYFLLRR